MAPDHREIMQRKLSGPGGFKEAKNAKIKCDQGPVFLKARCFSDFDGDSGLNDKPRQTTVGGQSY